MRMKSDLKMPASWRFSAHKHGEHRELERCVEKAMLNLLSECMFGGIMITYNLCIGTITPPVGNILFVGVKVAKVKLEGVIKPLLSY